MSLLFGISRRDRDLVISTVQKMGETTVPKLSAELQWPERRLRLFLDRVAEEDPRIAYSAVLNTVSVRAPLEALPPSPPPAKLPSALQPPPAAPPAAPSGTRIPKSWGGTPTCPNCRIPFEPTGAGNITVCLKCGTLSRSSVRTTMVSGERASPGIAHPIGPTRALEPQGDRKKQEMFAAWVTARPIPCPKCRTSLRHRGVGEYLCPSCGHAVAFPKGAVLQNPLAPSTPAPAPTPPAAPRP